MKDIREDMKHLSWKHTNNLFIINIDLISKDELEALNEIFSKDDLYKIN